MENSENEIVTALEIARDTLPAIGSKQSHLTKRGNKVISRHGGNSVPALIEWLKQPKRVKLAKNYDPVSVHKSLRKLPDIQEVAVVITGSGYDKNIRKVRAWLPYAFRESLRRGGFIVMQQAGHGKDNNGEKHHGEVTAMILCPENPSPALRKLVDEQIAKREKRGEMTKQQVEAMKHFIGEPVASA